MLIHANDPNYLKDSILLRPVGGVITDLTGKTGAITNTGTVAVTGSSSPFGSDVITFSGTNRLSFPTNAGYNVTNKDFTLEYWYYQSATGDASGRIFQTGPDDNPCAISTGVNVAGMNAQKITFDFSTSNSTWTRNIPSAATVVNGVWTHVAAVRLGNVISIYQDGVRNTTAALSGSLYYNSASTCILGGQAGMVGRFVRGSIYDLRLTVGVARYQGTTYARPVGPLVGY